MNRSPQRRMTTPVHDPDARRIVATNRRARHEYEIADTFQAGLVLLGPEVKSVRAGRISLQDAFCRVENGEAWLHNMHVTPYAQGNRWNAEPRRTRKILLHRSQIELLRAASEQKGLSIVPLSIYFQRGFARVEIALARGKKLYDKRRAIAERDEEREARRAASSRA